jgi:hypothetical protein
MQALSGSENLESLGVFILWGLEEGSGHQISVLFSLDVT